MDSDSMLGPEASPGDIQQFKDRVNKTLESTRSSLERWKSYDLDYVKLKDLVLELPTKTRHPITVPFGRHAFMQGHMVHTNEIMVLLGDNWFVERSGQQAAEIIDRRREYVKQQIEALETGIRNLSAKSDVTETGLLGLNEINEDGEAVFEIREEYDEAHSQRVVKEAAAPALSKDHALSAPPALDQSKIGAFERQLLERLRRLEIEEEKEQQDLEEPSTHSDDDVLDETESFDGNQGHDDDSDSNGDPRIPNHVAGELPIQHGSNSEEQDTALPVAQGDAVESHNEAEQARLDRHADHSWDEWVDEPSEHSDAMSDEESAQAKLERENKLLQDVSDYISAIPDEGVQVINGPLNTPADIYRRMKALTRLSESVQADHRLGVENASVSSSSTRAFKPRIPKQSRQTLAAKSTGTVAQDQGHRSHQADDVISDLVVEQSIDAPVAEDFEDYILSTQVANEYYHQKQRMIASQTTLSGKPLLDQAFELKPPQEKPSISKFKASRVSHVSDDEEALYEEYLRDKYAATAKTRATGPPKVLPSGKYTPSGSKPVPTSVVDGTAARAPIQPSDVGVTGAIKVSFKFKLVLTCL
ncbi:uncharacterized protein BJ171DRAFT_93117 [Polychytrium aggregatum]|uniref:uncharacterized protein n=1 Tax=Polychytrium aggregatum TaxID=110093 RepID=UPI0022FF20F5|nr:uncharacterized protein BJ171DRAFT_93117 [Polychytrium aggregatum]KAI9204961.1 hypothetical protein BJ171DRAFT_93117 [Polychytrium aggregatum]